MHHPFQVAGMGTALTRVRAVLLSDWIGRTAALRLVPIMPAWVTPNAITFARLGADIVAGLCIYLASYTRLWLGAAAVLMVGSWTFDYVDGALARARRLESERGYFLDRFADALAKIAIYLGIATSAYAHFQIIIFAPIVETLNDVVTMHRIRATGCQPDAPLANAHLFLMLLTPLVLTAIWPSPALRVAGFGLTWFDIAFLVGMTVSATEMALSAVRLYLDLSPPVQS